MNPSGALGAVPFSISGASRSLTKVKEPGQISASKRCLALAYESSTGRPRAGNLYRKRRRHAPLRWTKRPRATRCCSTMAFIFFVCRGTEESVRAGKPRTLLSAQSRQTFVSDNAQGRSLRVGTQGHPRRSISLLQVDEFLGAFDPALVFGHRWLTLSLCGGKGAFLPMESLAVARFAVQSSLVV